MEQNREHFRHILYFCFKLGKSCAQAKEDICTAYGEDAITERTCRNWYQRFREGNFSLEDKARCGRPEMGNVYEIQKLIDKNPHSTTREIADMLNVSHTTVSRHLQRMGYVNCNEVWIRPHNSDNDEPNDDDVVEKKKSKK